MKERRDGFMGMKGIDIASYQAGIDLTSVPCDFVIVKATGGTGYVNPDFRRALGQAVSSGKKVGVYHYARERGCPGRAAEEAAFFLEHVKDYIGSAILALDWEEEVSLGVSWAKEWLDEVWNRTGVKPMIYMSKSVCRGFDWSTVVESDYGLWAAQYSSGSPTGYQEQPWTDTEGFGAWGEPAIFQYSGSGQLPGWNGKLDLNLAYMNDAAWDKYACPAEKAKRRDAVLAEQNGKDTQLFFMEEEDDGYFRIKSKAEGMYLTVPEGKAVNGAVLEFIVKKADGGQLWKLTDKTYGHARYTLLETKNATGKYMSAEENGEKPGSRLKLWDDLRHDKQKFWVKRAEDGSYIFVHIHSLKVMEAA